APAVPVLPDDGIVELCEPALDIARLLGSRVADSPGVALFLDYGAAGGGDTLQAIRDGRFADPFADAGEADAAVAGPVSQGAFLVRLGLLHRTERLARTQPPERAAALLGAARRLSEPAWMGRLFQVLAIHSRGLPDLPGFAA